MEYLEYLSELFCMGYIDVGNFLIAINSFEEEAKEFIIAVDGFIKEIDILCNDDFSEEKIQKLENSYVTQRTYSCLETLDCKLKQKFKTGLFTRPVEEDCIGCAVYEASELLRLARQAYSKLGVQEEEVE